MKSPLMSGLICVLALSCKTSGPGSSQLRQIDDPAIGGEDIHNLDLRMPWNPKLKFSGNSSWTKFILTLDDNKVYFMNANEFSLHYPFAVAKIPKFSGASVTDYDAQTLLNEGRTAVAGGVIVRNGLVALDLVAGDPLDDAFAIDILRKVASRILKLDQHSFAYMPTLAQRQDALASASLYAEAGFPIVNPLSLAETVEIYSEGWAVGRLTYIDNPDDIDAAYTSGRLKWSDILLTGDIPAEIPLVAGIVALRPATPNSHVAILAKSFGVPFAFTQDEVRVKMLKELVGKTIYLLATGRSVDFVNVQITERDKEAIAAAKSRQVNFPSKSADGPFWQRVADIEPKDARYFGGKAANFGILFDSISNHMPKEAIAFSFAIFDAYLSQATYEDEKIGDYIRRRLRGIQFPVADLGDLEDRLKKIRKVIRGGEIPPSLQKRIKEALRDAGFVHNRKVRFRSSTNVEDGASFSGAGLYDSYSGCFGDDLDGDSRGPSVCNPNEEKEKGVFRAIKRVIGSFYNLNAFIERLRHKIPEDRVGMAVLVHYSFPDPQEMANGVITVTADEGFRFTNSLDVTIVSQVGAESITNPVAGALPEVVRTFYQLGDGNDDDDGGTGNGEPGGSGGIGQFDAGANTDNDGGGDATGGGSGFGQFDPQGTGQFQGVFVPVDPKTGKRLALTSAQESGYALSAAEEDSTPILVQRYSERLSPGRFVLGDEGVYSELVNLVAAASQRYMEVHELAGPFTLDLEYKLFQESPGDEGKLILKQIRTVPVQSLTSDDPYVVGGGAYALCPRQGGSYVGIWSRIATNLFYRGEGSIHFRSGKVSELLSTGVIESATVKMVDGDGTIVPVDITGTNGANFRIRGAQVSGKFVDRSLEGHQLGFSPAVIAAGILRPGGGGNSGTAVSVEYQGNIADLGENQSSGLTHYFPCRTNPVDAKDSYKLSSDEGDLKLEFFARFAAEQIDKQELLLRDVRNFRLQGLTSTTISVERPQAMGFAASHHNFLENFLFDLLAEPDISTAQKAELEAKGVRYLYVESSAHNIAVEEIPPPAVATISSDARVTIWSANAPRQAPPFAVVP